MREIKFRAWDGIKMVPGNKFFVQDGRCYEFGEFDQTDYPLMQYTGLKDRSGVEIYEGDILKERECCCVHQVIWVDYLLTWLFNSEFLADYPSSALEVIGNIYENPELLEGE